MKELSIEEKAKRYDEAIEKLRSLHDDYDTVSTLINIKEELEHIFPELKESEDERIRKALIDRIECFNEKHMLFNNGLSKNKVIAWLEKQGEQNPAWSEEDENKFDMFNIWIQYNLDAPEEEKRELLNWLKSIRNRVLPQPKQEWSGGDEAHLHSLITHLEQWIERHPNTTGADIQGENVAWLKSLRPQNGWKPSDRELGAILAAIGDERQKGSDVTKELLNIYQQLKKLREE